MNQQRLSYNIQYHHPWVEGAEGVLEYHLHVFAQFAKGLFAQLGYVNYIAIFGAE